MQLLLSLNPLDKPLLQALRSATSWFYFGFIFDILRQTEVGAASHTPRQGVFSD